MNNKDNIIIFTVIIIVIYFPEAMHSARVCNKWQWQDNTAEDFSYHRKSKKESLLLSLNI